MEKIILQQDFDKVGFHSDFKKGEIISYSKSFYHDGFMAWSVNVYKKINDQMISVGTIRQSHLSDMIAKNNNIRN